MRRTSIDAYNKIKNTGLLSKRRFEVYDFIFNHGPATARQAWQAICPHLATGGITPRFSELKQLGVIIEVGKIVDEVSNQEVYLWDVTESLPSDLPKKEKTIRVTKTGLLAAFESVPVEITSFSEIVQKVSEELGL